MKDVLPMEYRREIIKAPKFFTANVDKLIARVSGRLAPVRVPEQPAPRIFGGGGFRLGGN
jgi:hypothetical protein